jgi:hypothetical protein
LAFHVAAIALLVTAIDRVPLGGTAHMGGSIDLVLNSTAAASESLTAGSPPVAQVAPPVAPTMAAPAAEAVNTTSSSLESNTGAVAAGTTHTVKPNVAQGGNYGPPGEGRARVQLFGVAGVGRKFVYVFDRSTSMEGPPLAAAKQQLIQSLAGLDGLHQFHIIFFNQQLRSFSVPGAGRRIAFATDRNKQLAAKFVGGITADGGTDRLPALRAAIAMQPDVIFFLTDADDPMPASELAEIERLNRRAGATISTIEFGRGPQPGGANFLTELAQLTGGQYGYVDTLQLRN